MHQTDSTPALAFAQRPRMYVCSHTAISEWNASCRSTRFEVVLPGHFPLCSQQCCTLIVSDRPQWGFRRAARMDKEEPDYYAKQPEEYNHNE